MKEYPRDWEFTSAGVADALPLPRPAGCSPLKTLVDWPLALVALLLSLPAMVVIALAIRLAGGGPVLHKRRVLGRDGCEFDAFKFRTMVVGADTLLETDDVLKEAFQKQYKLENDPRVTRLGRTLRRYSLDELPQLVNVLTGKMALVGPRMISREELARYGPFADKLLSVKPGISGLWQTSGRQTTTYAERVTLDMFYIDHWSAWLDLKILLRTFRTVVHGGGAY